MTDNVIQIVHLKSTRTQRVYRVMSVDPTTKTVRLKGKHGSFTQLWDPPALKAMGYERVLGPFDGMIEE